MKGIFDRLLFIISTVAALSQFTTIRFLHQYFPHNTAAITTGYSSNKAIEALQLEGIMSLSNFP